MTATVTRIYVDGVSGAGWYAKPCPTWCTRTTEHAQGEWPIHQARVGRVKLTGYETVSVLLSATDQDGTSLLVINSAAEISDTFTDVMVMPIREAGAFACLLDTLGADELSGLVSKAIAIEEGTAS